jgi:hypothetical protein
MANFLAAAAINAVMDELKTNKYVEKFEALLPEVENVLKEIESNIDWAKVVLVISDLNIFKNPEQAARALADLQKVLTDINVAIPEIEAVL